MNRYPIPEMGAAARALREHGCTQLGPCNDRDARLAQKSFRELIEQVTPAKLSRFSFCTRPRPCGTRENDLGFIDWVDPSARAGAMYQKDRKYVFHYHPSLVGKLQAPETRMHFSEKELEQLGAFLASCGWVYVYNQLIAEALLSAFDSLKLVPESFRDACVQGNTSAVTDPFSLLRVLYYPGGGEEKRAGVHFDKALLTLHSCDEGGELFVRHEDGEEQVVSPPPQSLFAFWGVKADLIAHPHGVRIPPVAHGSRARPGEARSAVIFFCHSAHDVWDAPKVLY